MKNWIQKNEKKIIISAFIIPIIIVALVSISHVTQWYGLSNPISWSIYLSIGVEIAAMSSLAAITARMGKNVYFPFIVVTLIQFIGNIFFSYSYIDITTQQFKNWVELVSPILDLIGIESNDFIGHKRFLSLFSGGMLPIISLSFLHMLVKFTEKISEENKLKIEDPVVPNTRVIIETTDDVKPVVEKKTEVVNKEHEIIEDVKPLDGVSDSIEPIIEEVIEQEEIIEPDNVSDAVEPIIEEVIEQEEIIEPDNVSDAVEPIIEEVIEQEEIIEQTNEIEKKNIKENFTSTSSTLENVKNSNKIKRKGMRFTPPNIKWGGN